ncbi:MAG: DUF3097 domain-containing protein [Frankiaceae bacterium]|nr:DUF3097 domain-containing protein [Frankiaceae bacterium]
MLADDPRRRRSRIAVATLERGMVVEDGDGRFAGAVIGWTPSHVTLEDRHGRRRLFPLVAGGFLVEGQPATLVPPAPTAPKAGPRRTASGSFAGAGASARGARGSRIWVEGLHDAALIERVWGDDLRVEGVVVEPLDGVDVLAARIAEFGPNPGARLGVLVDHLVPGTKESRLVSSIRDPNVRIAGHPYVDVWEAVKPAALGIAAWPRVPRGVDWKTGVCAALGVPSPADMWRRVLGAVHSYADLEVPLLRSVESLIDFVCEPPQGC